MCPLLIILPFVGVSVVYAEIAHVSVNKEVNTCHLRSHNSVKTHVSSSTILPLLFLFFLSEQAKSGMQL